LPDDKYEKLIDKILEDHTEDECSESNGLYICDETTFSKFKNVYFEIRK